jgi:hypothetical protein
MTCIVLATRASLDRHTGVNLAAEVNNTMKEFGLEHRVFASIHDNAANVNLAGQMINGTKDRPIAFNIGCAAHSLNLSIGDAMKKGVDQPFENMVAAARRLVGHFKMSSLATNGLRTKVKEMLSSEHHGKGLIQDVSTRWNSTFYMLERLSLLRWPVVAVLSDQSLTKPQEARVLDMPAKSWKLAEEIIPVLRKVELATVLFSSQSKTTSGVVLPAITGLVEQLKAMTFECAVTDGRRRATTPPGQNFRDTLVQSLTERFFLDQLDVTYEETNTCEPVPFYLLASFMDPRFRDLSFLSEHERHALVKFASKTVKAMPSLPTSSGASTSTSEPEVFPPPKKKSKSEVAMEELLGKGKSSNNVEESTHEEESQAEKNRKIDKEVQQLSNKAPIGLTEDPLIWWKENEKRYPFIRNLAARVLAALPTSVPSEEIFSKAGLVVSKKRASLKPAVVDAILFLNKNDM